MASALNNKQFDFLHVGIIPDGNRRWSRANNTTIDKVVEKLHRMIMNSFENGKFKPLEHSDTLNKLSALSIYVLSKDNLVKRKDETIDMIRYSLRLVLNSMNLYQDYVKIQFIGELELLPLDIIELCDKITSKSNPNSNFIITVGIAYDPLKDAKRIVNEDSSRPHQPNIDLVIRTGGEIRSSGFFPLHTMYSEWIYLKKMSPDLDITDIDSCIEEFLKRNRRFGS